MMIVMKNPQAIVVLWVAIRIKNRIDPYVVLPIVGPAVRTMLPVPQDFVLVTAVRSKTGAFYAEIPDAADASGL